VPFSDIAMDPGIALAFSDTDADRQPMPYEHKPCDKVGNAMPELLWELVQLCFKGTPSERPAVTVLADVLDGLKKHVNSREMVDAQAEAAPPIASGSGSSRRRANRRSLSPSSFVGDDSDGMFPPSLAPSPSPSPLPTLGKGKQRVDFEEEYTTVRFGPLDVDGDPEDVFAAIFEALLEIVRKNVLVEPVEVDEHDDEHLAIRFNSLVEANNFAMTWMVYRFEPYLDVSAVLV
jgi:hypothetical protein